MKLSKTEQLEDVHFDGNGLVPVVTQNVLNGTVLMVAYANRAALEQTLQTGLMHFYSRSRQSLWRKGATSGNVQHLIDLHLDCDNDSILARVVPAGPACHTGDKSCFSAEAVLSELAEVVRERAVTLPSESYTTRLFKDQNLRLKKLGEEAMELALACQSGDASRVVEESADLIYHALVALTAAGASLDEVLAELARRSTIGRAMPSVDKQPEDQ